MSEKEQQFERIYKKTENFERTQFVREIQMQINDNKRKDKEIERLKQINEEHQKLNGELRVENDRLNNAINELEKIIDIEMNKMGYAKYDSCLILMKMKIKELKGDESNGR